MSEAWNKLAAGLLAAFCLVITTPAALGLGDDAGFLLDREITAVEADGRLDARELDELVIALAETEENVSEWLASSGSSTLTAEDAPAWLADPACEWRLANPLLLHAARAAAIDQRHETALGWLDLRDANTTRPATVTPSDGQALALFYRAVALHQLVRLDEAIKAAEALNALPTEATALRHRHTAKLILRDAKNVDAKSLGFVARLMGDSRRRLSLGRSGQPERDLQQDIVDRLDKAIEELEEQQRQQQQAQQQAQGGSPSQGSTPMEQSRLAEMNGEGAADDRRQIKGDEWGSLPPAERERVTQQIARDFPGHYRLLIEQYFRALADPESDSAAAPQPARVQTPPDEAADR